MFFSAEAFPCTVPINRAGPKLQKYRLVVDLFAHLTVEHLRGDREALGGRVCCHKMPTVEKSRARSHSGSEGTGPPIKTVRQEVGVSISRVESKGLKRLVELIASIRGYESGAD
jgi:hypothetical protein